MRSPSGRGSIWLVCLLWASSAWAELPRPAGQYRDDVIRAARFYLPLAQPSWLAGQIHQESRWDGVARSAVGAMGLLQIMPATAKDIARTCQLPGFDALNPRQAIRGGACYDAWIWRFVHRSLPGWTTTVEDQWTLTLRGYNGGAGYLLREAALAGPVGRAEQLNALCRRIRSSAACEENTSYPTRIRRWALLYAGWN